MSEADHIWQALNLRYGSNLVAATVTLLLKDCDKAVRFVTITIPQTGSDLPTTGWRKRQIALDKKAENARELGLDYAPDKTIIEMAREVNAVFDVMAMGRHDGILFTSKELKAFEALIRADEREACAKVCTELAGKIWQHKEFLWECCEPKTVAENVCTNLADTIRARGNT